MEDKIQQLKNDVELIKKRNLRVEADKAWETSMFRILSICVITYVTATAVMYFIGVKNVWLNALVPTLGYYLSTQSLPAIKSWWIKRL